MQGLTGRARTRPPRRERHPAPRTLRPTARSPPALPARSCRIRQPNRLRATALSVGTSRGLQVRDRLGRGCQPVPSGVIRAAWSGGRGRPVLAGSPFGYTGRSPWHSAAAPRPRSSGRRSCNAKSGRLPSRFLCAREGRNATRPPRRPRRACRRCRARPHRSCPRPPPGRRPSGACTRQGRCPLGSGDP